MRQLFTVIEGGAGRMAAPAGGASPVSPAPAASAWRIDLRRAAAFSDGEIAAWRALLVRVRVADPVHADPDYLLSAAQHQAGGRDLVFALAWRTGNGPDQLAAIVPLAMPHTLWGQARIAPWQPHGTTVAPTIAPDSVGEVREALADHLRALRPRAVLVLESAVDSPKAPEGPRLLRAVIRRASIPTHSLIGVRTVPAASRVERISDPYRVRDAVEEFLLLDAQVSAAPIIGDPSEAALVRVVTRLFAQRRQVTVALTRRGDAVVAASITLGHGAEAVVWRRVSEDASTGVAPRRADRSA